MRSKLLIGGLAVVVAFLLATSPLVAQAAGFISSADIINNTIKSADVKNNSLKGTDIKDNKLTGADINEATLGTVPTAANAANAANAATLAGQPPSAYQNQSRRYTLPVAAAATTRTYTFPGLPAGTYLATYHGLFDTAAIGHAVLCFFTNGTSLEALAYGAPAQFGSFSSVAATTVLQIPTTVTMTCNSQNGAAWTVAAGNNPSTVTFTRIDTVTPATAVRGADSGARGGPAN